MAGVVTGEAEGADVPACERDALAPAPFSSSVDGGTRLRDERLPEPVEQKINRVYDQTSY